MADEDQKKRAAKLRERIKELTEGNKDKPKSPRELTDQAAEEKRNEDTESN